MLSTIAGIALEMSWFVVKTTGGLIYSAVWPAAVPEETEEEKELRRLENLAVTNAQSLHRIEKEMTLLRQALSENKDRGAEEKNEEKQEDVQSAQVNNDHK